MSHTQGSWTVEKRGIGLKSLCIIHRGEVVSTLHKGAQNREANARLIAAAPELLEVLKDALNPSRQGSWEAKAKQAIAHAEGRE